MSRLVEVFCATQRHQKTKNKKNETQTKVRMAFLLLLTHEIPLAFRDGVHLYNQTAIGSVPRLSSRASNHMIIRPHT